MGGQRGRPLTSHPRGARTWAIGEALRDARIAAGVTQIDLAKQAGVSETCVSQTECGRVPSGTSLLAIAGALGLELRLQPTGDNP